MEQLTDLKSILHSKRANIYYLEMCRVMQKDGRVLFLTEAKSENQYWNIPIANTTPLIAANEIEWLSPQSEYRPTQYIQGWMSFWFDDHKRLQAAKQLQAARIEYMQCIWQKDRDLSNEGFVLDKNTSSAFASFTQHKALDFMFEQVQAIAMKTDWQPSPSTSDLQP